MGGEGKRKKEEKYKGCIVLLYKKKEKEGGGVWELNISLFSVTFSSPLL